MGHVAATAKRRRRQAKLDPRYFGQWRGDAAKRAARLKKLIENERMRQTRRR